MKNKTQKLINRIAVYLVGLIFLSVGTNLSVLSNTGVSPISSAPYALSVITGMELGLCVPLLYGACILLQIIILRRDFKIINLFQIVFAMIFGWFISVTKSTFSFLPTDFYWQRFAIMVFSLFVIAVGVAFYMGAGLLNLPAEGLSAAITFKLKKYPFHKVKIFVDCSFVLFAILSTFLFKGQVVGVREGTLIAAVAVGKILPYANKIVSPVISKLV